MTEIQDDPAVATVTTEEEAAPEAPSTDGQGKGGWNRRKFLIGAGAGAAVAAGAAYGISRMGDQPITTQVVSARIQEPVPALDPDSKLWKTGLSARVEMDGQTIAMPTRATAFDPTVTVRSVNDGTTIGFLIEWSDPVEEDLTIKIDQFRDACAVLLAPPGSPEGVRMMGGATLPVTLLHWKADWQRDVDNGFQDLEVAFPNVTFDLYPPLVPAKFPVKVPDDYLAANAPQWLPAFAAGNSLSRFVRETPVEKLVAHGFGTAEPMAEQNAQGKGVFKKGSWKVSIARPMASSDPEETALEAGNDYGLAIAIWSGQEQDRGGQKSPTKQLLQLRVEG